MTKTAWPFSANATAPGKRATTPEEWGRMLRFLLWGGVIAGELNELEVTASGADMDTDVASGRAVVQGFVFESTASEALTHDTADPSNDRIDRVILRLSWVTESVDLAILKGTPAGSPSAPALTQTFGTTWEVSLAQVLIHAADSTIDPGDVTDERTYTMPGLGPGDPADGDVWAYDAASGLLLPTALSQVGLVAVYKTANESVTSSTVLQDDDHLFFPAAANEVWVGDIALDWIAASTGDLKLVLSVPSGASWSLSAARTEVGGSSFGSIVMDRLSPLTAGGSGTGGQASFLFARFRVIMGATAGNVRLQWAQNSSDATATTLLEGSTMNAIRVD